MCGIPNVLKLDKPITKYILVCSKHFVAEDFTVATAFSKLRRLKHNVVPSQNIPVTSHSQQKLKQIEEQRTCYASRLPQPGETIHGTKFQTNFGGKGANQCVAAAKLGGTTTLIARVGDDLWGNQYIDNLKSQNVETKYVQKTAQHSSGIAQIIVAENGQNQIVVVAGANNLLSRKDVEAAESIVSSASVVVLQLETSSDVAIRTLQLSNGISILNGAPALNIYDPELLRLPTIFCVNETEAAMFTNLEVSTVSQAEIAARELIAKGCKSVILTLGSQGAIYLANDQKELIHVPCPQVQCIDTTGAGDAFIGALAYLLANRRDLSIQKTLEFACFIASDSVQRPGTQISFPSHDVLRKCSFF